MSLIDEIKKAIIKVTADTSEAEQSIENLNQKIEGLNNTPASDSIKSLKDELSASNVELEKIGKNFGKNSVQYEAMSSHISDVTNEIKNATKASESLNPANKLQPLVEVGGKAATAVKGTTTSIEGMSAATKSSALSFDSLKAAIASTGIGLLIVAIGR
jgi:chromosome segregation ATPase